MCASHQGSADSQQQGFGACAQETLIEVQAEASQHHQQRQGLAVMHADTMPDCEDRNGHGRQQGPLLHARVSKQGHAK